MKQGRASSSGAGSQKREPISHAVSPRAVAGIGLAQGNMTDAGPLRVRSEPLYAGRGIEAPMKGTTIHKAGSQRGR